MGGKRGKLDGVDNPVGIRRDLPSSTSLPGGITIKLLTSKRKNQLRDPVGIFESTEQKRDQESITTKKPFTWVHHPSIESGTKILQGLGQSPRGTVVGRGKVLSAGRELLRRVSLPRKKTGPPADKIREWHPRLSRQQQGELLGERFN